MALPAKDYPMDENRVSGTARNVGGKIEEGLGRVTGDTKIQAEGIAKQVSGADQDMYGHARDLASEAAGSARDTASSFEKLLRNTIEIQPYTTAFIALGIGWLLGRMHRPL
jgi:uncharacterized protein YjbJ (UPF0337 family)